MHYQGFDRLIKKMDEIAPELGEEVVMQIGSTAFLPKHAKYSRFLTNEEMHKNFSSSSLIISHCGAGSVLEALSHEKPLIVVPRMKKYEEAVDDSQMELSDALSEKGLATAIIDIENALFTAIINSRNNTKKIDPSPSLVNFIRRNLSEVSN